MYHQIPSKDITLAPLSDCTRRLALSGDGVRSGTLPRATLFGTDIAPPRRLDHAHATTTAAAPHVAFTSSDAFSSVRCGASASIRNPSLRTASFASASVFSAYTAARSAARSPRVAAGCTFFSAAATASGGSNAATRRVTVLVAFAARAMARSTVLATAVTVISPARDKCAAAELFLERRDLVLQASLLRARRFDVRRARALELRDARVFRRRRGGQLVVRARQRIEPRLRRPQRLDRGRSRRAQILDLPSQRLRVRHARRQELRLGGRRGDALLRGGGRVLSRDAREERGEERREQRAATHRASATGCSDECSGEIQKS
eukprot:31270-Pelagococcus_subviridis.AAC.28